MRQARDNKIGRQPVRLPPEKELFAYAVLDFPVLPMIMSISSTPTPRTMPMIDVMTSGVINRMAAAKVTARSHQLMSRLKKPDTVMARKNVAASIYLSNLNMELGKQISGFEPGTLDMLVRYDWPGNYAQFKRVLHELSVMTNSHYISGTDAAEVLKQERTFLREAPDSPAFSPAGMTLEEITRNAVEQALAANRGNQSETARQLGISRSTLWRILNDRMDSKKKEKNL